MASTQAITPKAAPLSMLKRLSPQLFLYEPPADATPDPAAPALTIVIGWYAAAESHLAKYINQHLALNPATRLLLITCPFRLTPHPLENLHPAIDLLKTLPAAGKDDEGPPQLLIHSFSNGGSFTLVRLAGLWRQHAPTLPRHALIIDSSPDRFSVMRSIRAITAAQSRWVRPLLSIGLGIFLGIVRLLRLRGPHGMVRDRLVDSDFLTTEVRRTYVFSKSDEMVKWQDVLDHADETRAKAAKLGTELEVRTEEFVGSGHVSHARVDGDRYWRIVRETYEGTEENL
ncbi:hypothetical protein F5X68DRAFT_79576 [Plectosphaerella plurivora]|uniref:Indole-diterpene biosynthesis protein PaxU n=1 Tax=Plectosphaerella plurivora TaxID=936078 RepID=A0A9P8VCB5_9PEZI|nr:hypothetical protein F5X68DRAFT_79576 [Plectosphaerella plurivora]